MSRSYEEAGLTWEMLHAIAHEMLQDGSDPDPDPDWIAEHPSLGFRVYAETDEILDWIADVYPIERCSQCDGWFEAGEVANDEAACQQCLQAMQAEEE